MNAEKTVLTPTIFCGRAGSRLWPISRKIHLKFFMHLDGEQGLLQKAWLRGAVLPHIAESMTVTNRERFSKTENECCEVADTPSVEHKRREGNRAITAINAKASSGGG